MAVYYGVIKDNTVVLEGDAHLPDGMEVEVRQRLPSEVGTSNPEVAFFERLHELGLLVSLPQPGPIAGSRRFEPIVIEGEPLSQTIIAERR